jgi:hypothetical protein
MGTSRRSARKFRDVALVVNVSRTVERLKDVLRPPEVVILRLVVPFDRLA